MAERRVIPSSNEKIINLVRPERVLVGYGDIQFFLQMSVECVQAHTLMLHVIPKQERVGTIGDGVKPGVPTYGGAWGRKCPMRDKTCPTLDIFTPSPFVPDK